MNYSIARQFRLIVGLSLILIAIATAAGQGYALDAACELARVDEQLVASPSDLQMFLRIASITFLVIFVLELLVIVAVYQLYQRYNPIVTIITCILRGVYLLILGVAMLFLFKAAFFSDPSHVAQDLSNFSLVRTCSFILFGIHLSSLGCLLLTVRRSSKLVGLLLVLAGICYIIHSLLDVFSPTFLHSNEVFSVIFSIPMLLGELSFAFWLLLFKR